MNKIIEFSKDPEQIKVSKATGGRIEDAKPEAWEDNSRWVAEVKIDGTRLKMEFTKEGNRITTRRISTVTEKYMERSNNFPHLRDLIIPELEGTILDGEGVASTGKFKDTTSMIGSGPEHSWEVQGRLGKLEYIVFDIIKYKGKDLTGVPYKDRCETLGRVVDLIRIMCPGSTVIISKQINKNKKGFYETIVQGGGEGVLLKNLNSLYYDRQGMKKVKRFERFTMIIKGFKDGTGKYEGQIGAIEIGFCDSEKTSFASGMTDELRKEISLNKKEYLGKIVEIETLELTKAGALRHPRWVGPRVDKSVNDCTINQNKGG